MTAAFKTSILCLALWGACGGDKATQNSDGQGGSSTGATGGNKASPGSGGRTVAGLGGALPATGNGGMIGAGGGPGGASGAGGMRGPDGGSGAGLDASIPRSGDASPGATGTGLVLELPAAPPVGLPFPVIVATADGRPLTIRAMLTIGDQQKPVEMRRGRGSVSLIVTAAGAINARAVAGDLTGERKVMVAARTLRMVTGMLDAKDLKWTNVEDIVMQGNVIVPEGAKLVIDAGTRILGNARANLEVLGSLEINGTAADPVLFTRATDAAWGGIRSTGKSEFHHALITHGGGDETRSFGHKVALDNPKLPLPTQPLLLARVGDVVVDGGGFFDSRGKGPSGEMNASLTIRGALITRVSQGGETHDAQIIIEKSHIMEIPKADGLVKSDDADGYHLGPPRKQNGMALASVFRDTVVAFTEDDGIDHNATDLTIERVWVENTYHEGIAISESGQVMVKDTVVTRSGQGIEVGWGKANVVVKNVVIAGCGVGLRVGDDYEMDVDGTLKVSYAMVLKDALVQGPVFKSDFPNIDGTFWDKKLTVWNYLFKTKGPKAGAMDIGCSMVQSPDWDGKQNNLAGTPPVDAKGCVEQKMLMGCPDGPIGVRTCP